MEKKDEKEDAKRSFQR